MECGAYPAILLLLIGFQIFVITCHYHYQGPVVPEVDVIFAVGATTRRAAETLRTMKDTLAYVINTYGVGSIRYGVISFGTDATISQRFGPKDPSPEDLTQLVLGLPASTGPPVLDRVLNAAKNVFEGSGLRPNAMKVITHFYCFASKSQCKRFDVLLNLT